MTVIEEILGKTMPQVGDRRLHGPPSHQFTSWGLRPLFIDRQVMSGVGDKLVPESERIASNVNELEVGFDPAK